MIQKAGKLGKYEREAECRSDRSRILKSVLSNERVGRTRDEDGAKQQVEQGEKITAWEWVMERRIFSFS